MPRKKTSTPPAKIRDRTLSNSFTHVHAGALLVVPMTTCYSLDVLGASCSFYRCSKQASSSVFNKQNAGKGGGGGGEEMPLTTKGIIIYHKLVIRFQTYSCSFGRQGLRPILIGNGQNHNKSLSPHNRSNQCHQSSVNKGQRPETDLLYFFLFWMVLYNIYWLISNCRRAVPVPITQLCQSYAH